MCSREPLCIPDTTNLLDDTKTVGNKEDELNNAMQKFSKILALRGMTSFVDSHLAPIKHQFQLLHTDIEQIRHLIKLAQSGWHAIRDSNRRAAMKRELLKLENLKIEMESGHRQLQELSCLIFLTEKKVADLEKSAPNESQYLKHVMDSANKLTQMENRLDIASKQFNVMNAKNSLLRNEINRLLIERHNFNIVWYHLIARLVTGKMYLLDVIATANYAFNERGDCLTKLKALKWKANSELQRDIDIMQDLQHKLHRLQKQEEFLRVKGTRRVCETVITERRKHEAEEQLMNDEIIKLNGIIDNIEEYCEQKPLKEIIKHFSEMETGNRSIFELLCFVFADYKACQIKLGPLQKTIDIRQKKNVDATQVTRSRLQSLIKERDDIRQSTIDLHSENTKHQLMLMKITQGIDELAKIAKIDYAPIFKLLGAERGAHKYNVTLYLRQIQRAIVQYITLFDYNKFMVTTVKKSAKKAPPNNEVADPSDQPLELIPSLIGETLHPNNINKLVVYQPCAYCVEEFIMNQVRDTPWALFSDEDVMEVLNSHSPNTPFGIFTITDPSKRHTRADLTAME